MTERSDELRSHEKITDSATAHAAWRMITIGRLLAPEFVGPGYQLMWWLMVGLYVVVAIVVVLVGGHKQLITHIPRRDRQDSAVV